MNKEIDENNTAEKYNNIKYIWDDKDKWHYVTYKTINNYINRKFSKKLTPNCKLLNAGSGGNTYNLFVEQIHLDIADKKISHLNNSVVGSICNIPFKNNTFDACLCVGSALNYCDAMQSINEMARVLRNKGFLLLEFEVSNNVEYKSTSAYKQNVGVVSTFYQNHEEKIYVYSPSYIINMLNVLGFKINNIYPIHIFSSIMYKISKNSNFSSKFSYFDHILRKIPFCNNFYCDVIIFCEKNV